MTCCCWSCITGESVDTLEISQRTDGKWLVEDTAYRVTFGPYESREKAVDRKLREVQGRLAAIKGALAA